MARISAQAEAPYGVHTRVVVFVVFFLWKVATAVKVTVRTISYESNYVCYDEFVMILYTSQFPFVFDLLVLYTYISALCYAFKETLTAFLTEHC